MSDQQSMRERAVALARQGFSVFPLPAGKKSPPLVPEYMTKPPKGRYHQHIPTDDPAKVYAMWTARDGESLEYNIAINTNRLLVVDVDNKGEKRGTEGLCSLFEARIVEREEPTLEAFTPTGGGRHIYFRLPEGVSVANTQEQLAPGIDTRSWNGYVVAPGSKVPAGEYEWVNPDVPIAEASESLIRAHQQLSEIDKQPKQATAAPGVELDSDDAVERARRYCRDEAPDAVETCGGREVTKHLLFRLGDFGLSASKAVDVLCEHWNPEKASPPWDYDELLDFAEGLEASRENPLGCDHPMAGFSRVPGVESGANGSSTTAKAPAKKRLFWRRSKAAGDRALVAGDPLIKGLLGRGEMSVLYGDSNTGKTFIALDFGYHIATGRAWNGRNVKSGLVVYVAAEAGESINARVKAWIQHYGEDDPPLAVVPCLVDLYAPTADLQPLLALLAEIAAAYGTTIELVVLDTLARVMGGGDENTAKDMGMLVGSVDKIRVATGAHVMLVHHSGKNKANGARGSSALRAATDTELEVENGQITVKKQRNGEMLRPVGFNLKSITLGTDSDGDSVTSCVVDIGAAVDFAPQLTHEQREWMAQIAEHVRVTGLDILTRKDMQTVWDRASGGLAHPPLSKETARDRVTVLEGVGGLRKLAETKGKSTYYAWVGV